MRDLALIGFLVSFVALGFRRPFIFVLAYAYVDIVSPQRLSYYLLNNIQVSLITFGLAILSWAFVEDKRNARFTARQGLMVALLLYCWMTTINADFALEAAEKWSWVWKALVFAIFLPFTLTTRLRIEALALVMTLSAGSIIIVGGIKTLASGGGYGVLNLMVDNNSGLYESSTIATVAIAIIPLILYLMNHGTVFPPDWRVKTFCLALCFAALLIPIGTEARTGLICIGILGMLMLRFAKRPILYIMLAGTLGLAAIPFMPETFMKRMDTINEYKADTSASTRIAVWKWTWDYVQLHPTGGGFEAYRQNSVRYETAEAESASVDDKNPNQAGIVVDESRAYHSAYFEMLGEQGFPGLIMWLLIHIIGIFRMEAIYRRYRKRAPEDGQWIGALASALQQGHVIYMFGSIFVGIAFQPFVYMLVGMQIGLDSYAKRREQEARWRPLVQHKAVPQGV